MPLFSEKVELCKPKVNDIRFDTGSYSTEHRKSFRYERENEPLLCMVTQHVWQTKNKQTKNTHGISEMWLTLAQHHNLSA